MNDYDIHMPSTHTETVAERITRLEITDVSEKRMKSLTVAHERGVSDEVFKTLGDALRLTRNTYCVLPAHRFENLSRGRGWARKGKGASAVWGEKCSGGYQCGPGRWVVGGNDGFSRKGEDSWEVKHIQVGDETWTYAN